MSFVDVNLGDIVTIIFDDPVCRRWIVGTIIFIAIFLVGFHTWLSWKHWNRGDDVSFLGFKRTVNPRRVELEKQLHEAAKQFDQLNIITEQKKLILGIIDGIVRGLKDILNLNNIIEFEEKKPKLYNFILTSISTILTKSADNFHRACVFQPTVDRKELYMAYGPGYSPTALSECTFEVEDSFAGWVYKRGEPRISGDIKTDPLFKQHPKATKDYDSLACLPIIANGQVIGVLSIDGKAKNSFSEDDEHYIRYFANILGLLHQILEDKHKMLNERRGD